MLDKLKEGPTRANCDMRASHDAEFAPRGLSGPTETLKGGISLLSNTNQAKMKRDRSESLEIGAPQAEKKVKAELGDTFGKEIRTAYDLTRAIRSADVLDRLAEIRKESTAAATSWKNGDLDLRFQLKVIQAGCEFEGSIGRLWTGGHVIDCVKEIPKWLENAPVSGYGDNRTLETKIDSSVRNAREIPKEGFEVPAELIDKITSIWANNFLPSKVRVEPYKIHLYGEGGHFQAHKDTPETDLVGTFLVGIGDTANSDSAGNFSIAGAQLTAHGGEWVAFYPDIPHAVLPLRKGCRGVIAFKVFGLEDRSFDAEELRGKHLDETANTLQGISVPFGLVLEHEYPMGTLDNNLTGFDAIVLASARMLVGATIEIIPILVDLVEQKMYDVMYGDRDSDEDEEEEHGVQSSVYPFTRNHVDLYLGRNKAKAKEAVAWLKDVKNVPFYSLCLKSHGMQMSHDQDEINYTGNEADGLRESSVYLTYALLALPVGA
ncbi:hypothetical protein VNI00_009444 [Paramarasmius palmivorus]|uniref:Fe2OG dioxygenase domain-containing protein n=1 Tax=Paramarasmius palmivorus TaxID=297713 RepID=A0AAW0CQ92_9AGAR